MVGVDGPQLEDFAAGQEVVVFGEALGQAVEAGYYENPRAGSVAEVAEQLGCAPGTAAELLRRAESRVMGSLAETGPF